MIGTYPFVCQNCEASKNDRMPEEAYKCICGADMILAEAWQVTPHFEEFMHPIIGKVITSRSQLEKERTNHKSRSHPEGLYDLRDDKKFIQEMKYIKKHREEIKASRVPGYKPGLGAKFNYNDPQKHKFTGTRRYFFA